MYPLFESEPANNQTDSRAHVLVVDDDGDTRAVLMRMVEARYRATGVGSGAAALDALHRHAFDAVLLDVMMPGMDGLAVLRAIRDAPASARLPVILISALSDTDNVVRGLKEGANDFIAKPFDVNITLARLETQLALKRLHDEHQQAIKRLEDAESVRNRLFRVATHDLKNPLANIRMAEYVLREAVAHDPVGLQMMDTVSLSLDAMQEVIDDFMSVVVLQSGQLELAIKPVSAERAIYKTLLQYNVSAANKGITLHVGEVEGDVLADEARLTQALGNLVSNAIKYSPPGATVTLATRRDADRLRISVQDQGPGIPDDERHLLFTEFGRLTSRPTGQETSTGLGLWIVKTIITMMDGHVGVESPPEGGSVFWLDLPCSRFAQATPRSRSTGATAATPDSTSDPAEPYLGRAFSAPSSLRAPIPFPGGD